MTWKGVSGRTLRFCSQEPKLIQCPTTSIPAPALSTICKTRQLRHLSHAEWRLRLRTAHGHAILLYSTWTRPLPTFTHQNRGQARKCNLAARAFSGVNAIPLSSKAGDKPVRSAKRLSSPERWPGRSNVASGAIHPSDYPDINDDITNPAVTPEVEEDVDIEMCKDEPSFLAGQTNRTLHLSPIKVIRAPDGSLNRAALAGAALAKERRELRQQEQNDEADAEAQDFNAPWLDPMSKDFERMFAQDLRGNLKGQKSTEVPQWKEVAFNQTTYGEISKSSIQDQRKSLPIYKLRDLLLQAIADVRPFCAFHGFSAHVCSTASGAGCRWRHWLG